MKKIFRSRFSDSHSDNPKAAPQTKMRVGVVAVIVTIANRASS